MAEWKVEGGREACVVEVGRRRLGGPGRSQPRIDFISLFSDKKMIKYVTKFRVN